MPRPVATSTAAPFAKLVDLGDTVVGAFAGSAQRQMRNFKTGDPVTKADGSPAREEIIHFIAMPGTTAHVGTDESGYQAIEPGDHIRYSVSGFKWGQVIQGRKDLPELVVDGLRINAGRICSSDVYTIRLVGWSASTDNAAAAAKAGFTVVDGRIVMRTQDEKDAYVLARSRKNQSTGVGKDLEISVRRIDLPNEQKWADLADDLYDTRPWEHQGAAPEGPGPFDDGAPHPAEASSEPEEEPF